MDLLYALGALDDDGMLTRLGRKMAEFPLEPRLAKMLIMSVSLKCSEEILTVASMLSVDNVFYRPKDKQAQADTAKAKFFQPEGDQITLLMVYDGWKTSGFSNQWCFEHYIQGTCVRVLSRSQSLSLSLSLVHHRLFLVRGWLLIEHVYCSTLLFHSLSFLFFAARTMSRVEDIRKQLVSILDRYKMDVSFLFSFFFFLYF